MKLLKSMSMQNWKRLLLQKRTNMLLKYNTSCFFTITHIETLNALMILTVHYSISRTRMLWEKGRNWIINCLWIHIYNKNLNTSNGTFISLWTISQIPRRNLPRSENSIIFFLSNYSIDKKMVPCTGENCMKQTNQTKIKSFGSINFAMCSDDGYPYFIDPCYGFKCTGQNKPSGNLCTSVISCESEIGN